MLFVGLTFLVFAALIHLAGWGVVMSALVVGAAATIIALIQGERLG